MPPRGHRVTHAPVVCCSQDMFPRVFVDYRKDCARGVPDGAAVVCFPRSPKPHEVDAEWVSECWR